MRYFSFAVALWLVVIAPESEAEIIFTKIADRTTAIPSGSGNFNLFGPISSQATAPAVSGKNVVFIGSGAAAQEGLYLAKDGALTRVADRTTVAPGVGVPFSHFTSATISGSNVAFNGSTDSPFVVGIYKNVGAGLVKVSDTMTGGFSTPDIVGRDVYVFFDGAGFGNESIVTDAGGTLHTLVTEGTPTPGGTGMLDSINSNVAAANGAVAFFGSSGGQRGIYLARNGQLLKVADSNTAAPGSAGNFQDFSNVNIGFDGTDVAFAADAAGVPGLYRTLNGGLVNIVTSNTVINGYGKLSFGDSNSIPMSLDAGRIAFSNGNAIFADVDGSIQKVIGVGNQLFGKTVNGITFGTNGLSGDEIAFGAHFTDGSSGIFLATVPLPAALHVGVPVGAWIAYRSRRRFAKQRSLVN
jgi:hypothetical protein